MALVQHNYPTTNSSTIMDATVRMTSTTTANGGSRLAQMQARFQQKQMQEKEQKLLRLYESQQQRAFQRVGTRGSAGSSSGSSMSSSTSSVGAGKVRQLFDERRTTGGTGWDRSHPLEPLEGSTTKSKASRVASLDRSQNNIQTKPIVKRSKSHVRGGAKQAEQELNGSFRKQVVNTSVEVVYNGTYRKQTLEDYNSRYKKQNDDEFNGSFRIQNAEELDGSYRKPAARDGDDFNNGSLRKQEINNTRNSQQDFNEEEINYEHLGEDILLNGNQTFTIIDEKRQDLFDKYQARDVENNELLSASPPPGLYNDDLDDSFVFKKLPNVGGPPIVEETVKNPDKFKTYNANKKDKKMSPPAAVKDPDVKRGPVRRESGNSPPSRATKPAARKVEPKSISPPPTTRRVAKTTASPTARPAASVNNLPTTNMSTNKKPASSSKSVSPKPGTQRSSPTTQNQRVAAQGSTATRDGLTECHVCKRCFASDRIGVHESICKKTGQKKRKEYDATKHRVTGTDAEIFVRRAGKKGLQKKQPNVKRGDWRRKHEEFIQTIRAAKDAQAHVAAGGKLSDLPPPPPLDTSDYTTCPHCSRKFNDGAAERHIPRCATMLHNKPKVSPQPKKTVSTTTKKH